MNCDYNTYTILNVKTIDGLAVEFIVDKKPQYDSKDAQFRKPRYKVPEPEIIYEDGIWLIPQEEVDRIEFYVRDIEYMQIPMDSVVKITRIVRNH